MIKNTTKSEKIEQFERKDQDRSVVKSPLQAVEVNEVLMFIPFDWCSDV
jgi:hypothetical protein